jgi:hypothetical protein
MRELVLTDDLVLLSFLETLFAEAGISVLVLDRCVSTMPGAAGQLPQRVMVDEDDWERARRLLTDAGLRHWIVEPNKHDTDDRHR